MQTCDADNRPCTCLIMLSHHTPQMTGPTATKTYHGAEPHRYSFESAKKAVREVFKDC
jgi:hypothetical protein